MPGQSDAAAYRSALKLADMRKTVAAMVEELERRGAEIEKMKEAEAARAGKRE